MGCFTGVRYASRGNGVTLQFFIGAVLPFSKHFFCNFLTSRCSIPFALAEFDRSWTYGDPQIYLEEIPSTRARRRTFKGFVTRRTFPCRRYVRAAAVAAALFSFAAVNRCSVAESCMMQIQLQYWTAIGVVVSQIATWFERQQEPRRDWIS